MDNLKASIALYINNFSTYDYIAYGLLASTLLLLLLLALLFIKKSPKISLLLILLTFILFFTTPFALKNFLDKTLRPLEVTDVHYDKLHFSNTLILSWNIKNLSKKTYKQCSITTIIYKPSNSKFKMLKNKLNPIIRRDMLDKKPISPDEISSNRLVFNNFDNRLDINVSITAKCY